MVLCHLVGLNRQFPVFFCQQVFLSFIFLLQGCNCLVHLSLSAGRQENTWFRTHLKPGSHVPLVYLVQDSPVSLGLVQLVSELQQLLVGGELCPLGLVQIFAEVFDLGGVGRVPPEQLLLIEQNFLIKLGLQTGQLLLRLYAPCCRSPTLLRLRPEPEPEPWLSL